MYANRSGIGARVVTQWRGVLLAGGLALGTVVAETRTWDGTTGNWLDAARWSGGTVPQPGETAVVNSGSITLDATTADLAAFEMNGGTLTFTNWTTTLNAANIFVNDGMLTLPAAFTDTDMSNRVNIVCVNFQLTAPGQIFVKGRGYAGAPTWNAAGYGPGGGPASASRGSGGGHGGKGGVGYNATSGGATNDLANAPTIPGSGGGGNGGETGGGAVRIAASGTVTINGTINADGNDTSHHGGAGAGGAIFISCQAFAGDSNGVMTANGGAGGGSGTQFYTAGGGGGRIAVAIGLSDADVQKLHDEGLVDRLRIEFSHNAYHGDVSVAGGVSGGDPEDADGGDGTFRFLKQAPPLGTIFMIK